MNPIKKLPTVLLAALISYCALGQPTPNREIRITVQSSTKSALANATVSLLKTDSSLLRTALSDSTGMAIFSELNAGNYIVRVTRIGHSTHYTPLIDLRQEPVYAGTIMLQLSAKMLENVTVTARKPFVQLLADKTVVNVEAGITNAGATVMEVLERSPGITVDRDGNISMKGKPGVMILIDGKQTQLAGMDLQNLLSGMSASQVETIELMDNPSAKYDAAGNAGIINIKTKKNRQRGFNGSASASYGQGIYSRGNGNVQFNYRNGALNYFLTYSANSNGYMMDLYALRTYYNKNGSTASMLEQPYYTIGRNKAQTLKAGMDYFVSKKTTLGAAFTGTLFDRRSNGFSNAKWMNAFGDLDSVINTSSSSNTKLQQGGINFNARHVFDNRRELTADIDYIGYDITTGQYFENKLATQGAQTEASQGNIPTKLNILSAKADYAQKFGALLWETGWKTARVSTDNNAKYFFLDNGGWHEDLGKSNHFLYTENIHALYTNFNTKAGRWGVQAGLRYELTSYKANQLGNAVVKDSSFTRNYGNLFPSLFLTYQADSLNAFTLRTGRRIDRPPFQKLNPFVFIINKYTFQTGNPYFLPQYTWNIELSHTYKETFSTTLSYNRIDDYISQVFYSDTATDRITYTEGNVGTMQNFGLTVSAQLSPAKWWSLTAQATMNHKIIEGQLWKLYKASITQLNVSINNQFRFRKGWGGEISGFYLTRNQNDLQEVLDPTGQLSFGVSKQVLKNRGTIRLTMRDVFYTQVMAGWTHFESVVEYFKLMRDSRVGTLTFTWRFGKAMKQQAKRSGGAAADEMERVGTVN